MFVSQFSACLSFASSHAPCTNQRCYDCHPPLHTENIGFYCRPDNFDDFWRVASKIFPVPSLNPPLPSTPSEDPHPRSQSTDPSGAAADKDGAYSVRSVPCRIYLPDGPVLQDVMPPLNELGE